MSSWTIDHQKRAASAAAELRIVQAVFAHDPPLWSLRPRLAVGHRPQVSREKKNSSDIPL